MTGYKRWSLPHNVHETLGIKNRCVLTMLYVECEQFVQEPIYFLAVSLVCFHQHHTIPITTSAAHAVMFTHIAVASADASIVGFTHLFSDLHCSEHHDIQRLWHAFYG